MFKRAIDLIIQVPEGESLYLYRFDSTPAEVMSEPPPLNREGIAQILNETLEHRSATDGTNMAKLLSRMDRRLREVSKPAYIAVFTDCGTEMMSTADVKAVEELTSKWAQDDLVTKVVFYGVEAGQREKLQDMIKMPGKVEMIR
jgi:hypothetical protein